MINLGSKKIKDLRLGSKQVSKVYLGDKLIWQKLKPVFVTTAKYTKYASEVNIYLTEPITRIWGIKYILIGDDYKLSNGDFSFNDDRNLLTISKTNNAHNAQIESGTKIEMY